MASLPAPARRLIGRLTSGRAGTTLFGSAARVFALGAQFVIVLILTRLFTKNEFGNFMTVFAAYRLIAGGVGAGLAAVLLYHISRSGRVEAEVRLHRGALITGALIGVALCIAFWLNANAVAHKVGKPALAHWLQLLTPFLFFTLMGTITTGALEGRNRISSAIFMNEVAPNGLRLVLLLVLMLARLPALWVAHVMTVSAALPWLWSIRDLATRKVQGVQGLSGWDIGYAAKLALYSFAAFQVQGLDMIVAGWLFPAETVADYAIASRIASLFPFFLQLRVRMFGPVAGRLLATQNHAALQREALVAKRYAMALVTLSVAGLLLASPVFLKLFYASDLFARMLVLLAFPPVFRALFAVGDRLLQLAGHANWNLGTMLTGSAIVAGLPFLLGGTMGITALPVAMIISGALLNPVIAFATWRTQRIRLLEPADALAVAVTAAAVLVPLLAFSGTPQMMVSGAAFALFSGWLVWRARQEQTA